MTITGTLIEGLNQQMVQARLNSADAKSFHFGRLFPVKRVNGFTWKTLQNQTGLRNVAADLHTDNGTILRKKRPIFESAQGDLPFISISREMSRKDIKDYQIAAKLAQDPAAAELVHYWGDDVDFCFNGVQSELEFISLKLASGAGKLSFNTTTNATYANEFDLDYQVDEAQKLHTSKSWGDAKADIIGDLARFVKAAKSLNLNPKFAFVNLDEFYRICTAEQIIKACASYVANAVGMAQTPDLEQVNQMLRRQAWLNGIQLRVIDQTITREYQDGTTSSGNPFEDHRMVLSETEQLGTTQYDVLEDSDSNIIRAVRAHTVIKKYGTVEPKSEVTIAEADAVPVFDTAYRNLYIKTDGVSW